MHGQWGRGGGEKPGFFRCKEEMLEQQDQDEKRRSASLCMLKVRRGGGGRRSGNTEREERGRILIREGETEAMSSIKPAEGGGEGGGGGDQAEAVHKIPYRNLCEWVDERQPGLFCMCLFSLRILDVPNTKSPLTYIHLILFVSATFTELLLKNSSSSCHFTLLKIKKEAGLIISCWLPTSFSNQWHLKLISHWLPTRVKKLINHQHLK